jgi:hypothetical protein
MRKRVMWGVAVLLAPMLVWEAPPQHTMTATLNYDFTVDNACSATVTSGCVLPFNIYDLTGGGAPVR